MMLITYDYFQIVVAVGWAISTFLGIASIFGLALYFDEESFNSGHLEFSSVVRIGFGAFHRTAFALSLAWLIFACTRQYGGLLYYADCDDYSIMN